MRQKVIALALVITASGLQAQNPLIARGFVFDSTGRPLENVEVSAVMVGRVTRTNAEGHFQIDTVTPGRSRLLIRQPGWKAIDTTFMLDPKNPRELRFTMTRVAQALEEIRIVSHDDCPTRTMEGFECRRRAGLGAFRDSAEIAALKPVCTADIVYGMEGLRRTPGRGGCASFIPTTGWRCLTVIVDGKRISGANAPPALMSDYIGVEFYADFDHVPEWYKQFAFAGATQGVATRQLVRHGDIVYRQPSLGGRNCSLLVYWTHFAPRFDPKLDQNKSATLAMKSRRDSIAALQKSLVDSLNALKGKPKP
jgi:hypothetical protein